MKYFLYKDKSMKEFAYVDQDEIHYESPLNWLWTSILGGCGCGSSEELAEMAYNVLSYFATPFEERKPPHVYDTPALEILAHWLNSKGLLEHGSSIGASWLTEEGKNVYSILTKLNSDSIENNDI